MTRILLTAFEPFDVWKSNASQLCLESVMSGPRPNGAEVDARVYPVDFPAVRSLLQDAAEERFDYRLHLGQAAGSAKVRLERFALNIGSSGSCGGGHSFILEPEGPAAYRTQAPLGDWRRRLQQANIPAVVSDHAGTYLCNAALYWSQHLSAQRGHTAGSLFLHLPLAAEQTEESAAPCPNLPLGTMTSGVRIILEQMTTPCNLG